MRNWLRKALVTVLSVLLAGSSVVALSTSAEALKGSDFDPGLIISDSVFFDFGTMNASAVQRFLENQVKTCTDNDGGPKCLRNYSEDIVGSVAIKDLLRATWEYGMCKMVDPAKDQKASQIIVTVARACGINPRVLLVMLQKEQGLVQSPDPTDYMYKAAMGYGCPDSHPEICGKDAVAGSRLFAQLYRAAWQLRWYGDSRGSFTWLKPGRTVRVLYSPRGKAACGDKSFLLQSQATANLYYYTPYTPNAAALKNLYGSGDSCSAYGNRNFWRFFWRWFGSPVGGGFLLKSPTSDYYLVVDFDQDGRQFKYKYKLSDQALIDSYAPLGPLGVISQSYLDSFADGGTLGRLVKSGSNYYYVDNGFKYQLSSCATATALALDCNKAIELTDIQAAALQTGDKMRTWMYEDPKDPKSSLYVVQAGIKRAVLDKDSITAAGLTIPNFYAPVSINNFANLPWGPPIAPENTLFTNRTSKRQGLIHAQKFYEIGTDLAKDVDFANWFDQNSNSIRGDALATISANQVISSFAKDDTTTYVLTSAGKRIVTNPQDLGITAQTLPNTLLDRISNVTAPLETPALVRTSGSKTIYWLADGKLRPTDSAGTRAMLSKLTDSHDVQSLPKSALNALKLGGKVYTPGQLIKEAKGALLLVDGTANLIAVPNLAQAKLFALGNPVSKTDKNALAGYARQGSLAGIKVKCGDVIYLPVAGKLQPITPEFAKHYPGRVQKLADITCSTLVIGSRALGRFVQTADKKIYLVQDGKRRLVDTSKSTKQYLKLRGATPAAFKIDATAAALLPLGKPVSSKASKAIDASPAPSATPAPTATPTQTATPSPTPSATSASRPNPCTPKSMAYLNRAKTNWYHKVISGETLRGIATKCATTVIKLQSYNKITNANSITVGQVLRVTNY